jgi:protein tyrosine phosphatase (PTP) superfamily phosphohydrolase (DUF442 family)
MATDDIYNYHKVNNYLVTGGQPTEAQLRDAAAEGFGAVVNFATEQPGRSLEETRTLLHCAANFRVTAFYSLYAIKHLGWSEAQAETFRQSVWQGSDYPVWAQFIRDVKAQLPTERTE